jgi:hypothetical protein
MESTSSMLMAVGFSLGIPLFARRLCIAILHHPRTWLIAAVWIRVSDLELSCLSFLLLKLSLFELFSASFQRVVKERSAHSLIDVKLLKCVCNYSYRFSCCKASKTLCEQHREMKSERLHDKCAHRWLHMAMCVVFLSSRMCVNVISRMCM